ncbi:hypothetical protein HYH03_005935 [Edaphochlamys debaryana]|uniref:tRNA (adenine(58)-N(1))-methyltransferase n=1 Tax=Edaphochlamys debaryana TaxID=47281 RepID=A0A835Y774_9CHLO|nr:hypothetical protein HYH03_005935 [Edaphochlamys debaryana]|eukprot:KAG2496013.1 hypothetical protein HYH03_005935 [Edaphochlamys debaryana]
MGDCVIVYEGLNSMKAVYLAENGRFENRFGIFKHQSWVGKPFGCKVTATMGGHGWVYLLRPTPELWTQVLRHRTQILYLADISMAVTHLDLRPGSVVLESGTGSGSLTHSLIRAVAPTGHVHTFEFHPGRAEEAAVEFKQHGLGERVTVTQRNIEELGFPDTLHGRADAVFLDLPGPWKVIPSVAACLKPNGRFCGFSPCIEQIQRTAEALSSNGFTDIITYECLLREYEVHRETLATTVRLAEPPAPKRPRTAGPAAPAEAKAAAGPSSAAGGEAEGAGAKEAGAGAEVKEETVADAGAEVKAEVKEEAGAAEVKEEAKEEATPAPEAAAAEAEAGGSKAEEGDGGQPGTSAGPSAAAAAGAEAAAGEEQGGRGKRGGGFQRPPPPASMLQAVSARPNLEARGHTGYLIFARKFVCG